MRDMVRSFITYAVVIALIIGVFKLLKVRELVTIDTNDHSMEPEYARGDYKLDTRALSAGQYKSGDTGDVVAYALPGKPETVRVARVVAVPGETVALERQRESDPNSRIEVKVNGKVCGRFRLETPQWHFPPIVVPRGCLFLVADRPQEAEDSLRVGPVPFYCIRGKLN
jgi:signal peptidase I